MSAALGGRAGAALRRRLLAHYDRHRRDLPWRRTRDPYRIWLSEVMLQQTRVETVVTRYHRFLERFPNVETLAAARPEEVCEEWAGLGYYGRARNLSRAAREIVTRHGGALPRESAELERLPGIGRYTAGAIASIAFDRPAPVVDANVARVLSRLFAVDDPPRSAAGARRLWALAAELARGRRPGDLNQALMELGATICTPIAPACPRCPVAGSCTAREAGETTRYPRPDVRPARRPLAVAFAWIETRAGTWLEQRPVSGLWAGLWQLPGSEGAGARRALAERLGVELGRPLATIEHALSHRAVRARVYPVSGSARLRRRAGMAPYRDPLTAPLSSLARKALTAVLDRRQARLFR